MATFQRRFAILVLSALKPWVYKVGEWVQSPEGCLN